MLSSLSYLINADLPLLPDQCWAPSLTWSMLSSLSYQINAELTLLPDQYWAPSLTGSMLSSLSYLINAELPLLPYWAPSLTYECRATSLTLLISLSYLWMLSSLSYLINAELPLLPYWAPSLTYECWAPSLTYECWAPSLTYECWAPSLTWSMLSSLAMSYHCGKRPSSTYFWLMSTHMHRSLNSSPPSYRTVIQIKTNFHLGAVWRIRDVYPGSRILIFTHPGSRISDLGSRIPDPKTATKERGENNLLSYLFLKPQISQKWNLFCVWIANLANFQRIIELFMQKIVIKLSKIWCWDPGSEIRKNPIQDPGSRGLKGTGSRIRIRNTA